MRFVSISVDPIRDTPEVLRGYAMYARNDPRWMFLTGDRKTIVDLSVKGFKLAAGDATGRGERVGPAQREVRRRRQEGRDPRVLQRDE